MTRRRRALLTWSLLALAVLFLALFAFSLRYVDLVEIVTVDQQTYALATRDGSLFFVRQPQLSVRNRPSRWTHVALVGGNRPPGRNFLGFRSYNDGTWAWLAIPLWLPAILLLLLAWRLRRSEPPPPGFCRHCGYDLRASPDRCPECGRAVPVPSAEAQS